MAPETTAKRDLWQKISILEFPKKKILKNNRFIYHPAREYFIKSHAVHFA